MTKLWFLDNPHRLLAIMEPDADFNERKEKAHRDKMAELKSSLTESELEQINVQAAQLKKFQSEPDSPESAATIPKLKLEDIRQSIETIPTQNALIGGVQNPRA